MGLESTNESLPLSESARREKRAESAANTPLSGEQGTRHGVGSQHVIWHQCRRCDSDQAWKAIHSSVPGTRTGTGNATLNDRATLCSLFQEESDNAVSKINSFVWRY